jgi:hypothetical protein
LAFADVSHTFWHDVSHGHVRLGHGLIIIGLFSILSAPPHFIDSSEAGGRFLELREEKKSKEESNNP